MAGDLAGAGGGSDGVCALRLGLSADYADYADKQRKITRTVKRQGREIQEPGPTAQKTIF